MKTVQVLKKTNEDTEKPFLTERTNLFHRLKDKLAIFSL